METNEMRQKVASNVAGKVDPVTDRAVRHLANSIFQQLQDEGCAPKDIISVSSQLIDLVTVELRKDTV